MVVIPVTAQTVPVLFNVIFGLMRKVSFFVFFFQFVFTEKHIESFFGLAEAFLQSDSLFF